MKKGWTIGLLLISASLAGPLAANADPVVIACHGCSGKKAKLRAGEQVPMSWPAGVYDVYVVDNPGNRLRLYRITAEREGSDKFNYVVSRKPSAKYRGYFDQSMREWNYVSRALEANIVLEEDFPVQNAEQVFGNALNQTVISEQINISVPARIQSLFGAALQIAGAVFKVNIKLHAIIQFPDGSTAIFELVRLNHLASGHFFVYEYREGSALDSEGNRIPDSAVSFRNYGGTFW
ncbi:MAG: hypothetical protein ACR2QU_02430, partial [Gammaproteobacteria bacterium]